MDKNTLLAVVLSVVVITGGFVVQNIFFPPDYSAVPQQRRAEQQAPVTRMPGEAPVEPLAQPAAPVTGSVVPVPDDGILPRTLTVETGLFRAEFNARGGLLTSLQLRQHRDRGDYLDMIKRGQSEAGAFGLSFGGMNAPVSDALYRIRRTAEHTVELSREYKISGFDDSVFTVIKRFTFHPDEYLFLVDIVLENSVNRFLPLDFDGVAYTLSFGPQIGPFFQVLDPQHDYRRFVAYSDGQRRETTLSQPELKLYDRQATWAGIIGKYFTMLAAPVFPDFSFGFSTLPVDGLQQTSSLLISRPVIRSARNTDSYRFYAGPKTRAFLERYNDPEHNAFGIQNLNLDAAIDTNIFLGWLEAIIKAMLNVFYMIVPNWGVAIILVTILVRALLLPLTIKSTESTGRMQRLAPKLEEIKKKHGSNPQKMNQETAELYRREGVNPLSGCLPMLLQIPIFFAMYGLFSNDFDLRGAVFIPGWINDLSAPESIFSFAPFTLPFVGWSDIRVLPILFVATQIGSSLFTQAPGVGASNAQMKMIMYAMPVVFFFILYNVPSGLLVYWIVTNVLTAVQQLYTNKLVRRKESA